MKNIILAAFACVVIGATPNNPPAAVIENKWQPLPTLSESGFLGHHVDLWRNTRLWYVYESNFLLKGFENPPGEHLWQGEHVGKWLHAATLDYETTHDPKLLKAMQETVDRLLKAQVTNGYLGTYSEEKRFYKAPGDKTGWDIWTERYTIYGLLAYEKHHPDPRILEACKKIGDLLIDTYGEEMNDITKYGTRQGLSSTTLLESIVMLYERTGDKKYLEFAEQIVTWSEGNPKLRLMDAMLKNESVVNPGDGKAYQLMSNLLGYYRLYRFTGNKKYLETVLNAWKQIKEEHVLVNGGPWTRKMSYNANKECFAHQDAFDPWEIVVENCCTTTWIQLNLHLLDLTGEAKYADEAEKALFNQFAGGQEAAGVDWCYYTKPNEIQPPYVPDIHCCASSGPRALEMFARRLTGTIHGTVSINSFSSSEIELDKNSGGGKLVVKSEFPANSIVSITPEPDVPTDFNLEFRLPVNTTLKEAKLNGKKTEFVKNERGYYQLQRKWKKGDRIIISMNYLTKAWFQEGATGKKWVAFTYGPITLVEKISQKPTTEPFKGSDLNAEQFASTLAPVKGKTSTFSIKNSTIELIPYAEAGSRSSGPRTYFEIK